MITDFWRHSGYHLLEPGEDGRLRVTDDFLRAYIERPEVAPVAESCAAERALHAALLKNPREAVSDARLVALADADARENYGVVLAFRDRLAAAGMVEDCYLGLFADDRVAVPPLFVDQLVHVVLRGILDGGESQPDPWRVRAAELLFRPQTVMLRDGAVLVADQETVSMYQSNAGFGGLGRLVAEAQTPMRSVEMDVMSDDTAATYWGRDERYDMVLDVTFARPGLDALCRVLEAWIARFTGAATSIQPVASIRDERWVWHVGLDAGATAILNDLYNGIDVDEARIARILSLFRLEFEDASLVLPEIAGKPIYLAMTVDDADTLRIKPQNLLVNLPLTARA